LPTRTSSSSNGDGAAAEAAKITYGRLRVTTAKRGCSGSMNKVEYYWYVLSTAADQAGGDV